MMGNEYIEIEYFEGLDDRKKKAKEKVMNDILEKHQKLGQVLDAAGLDANHPAMLDWASVGMGIKNLLNERDEVKALPEKWRGKSYHRLFGAVPPEDGNAAEYWDEATREAADELEAALKGERDE